jgi:hypothetical protein
MHDCFTSYKFCHPLEKYNHRLAFYRDAFKLMNVIEKFTKNMLTDIFPSGPFNVTSFIEDINNRIPGIANENISDTDNLVRIISFHIYNVSVWHEQIGNMSWYILHPGPIRVQPYLSHPNSMLESEQNTYQNIFLALMTSVVSMPKLNSELHLTITKNMNIYKTFQNDLSELVLECEHLNVAALECSVSL